MSSIQCVGNAARMILVIFNIFFVIAGLCLICLSVWLACHPSSAFMTLKELDPAFANIVKGALDSSVLGVAGCLLFIPGIAGCCGALLGRPSLLYLYALTVSASLLLQLASGLALTVYRIEIESKGRSWLHSHIIRHYSDSPTPSSSRVVWNQLFTSLKCCGVNNYSDFEGSIFQENNGAMFPASCCEANGKTELVSNTECSPFKKGCVEVLLDPIHKFRHHIGIAIFIFLAFQLLLIILGVYLARSHIVYKVS